MNATENQKFNILLDGDNFGPKILFEGDRVRYVVPDTTGTELATVLEIPSHSIVVIQNNEGNRREIYRDRIKAVFPRFK